MDKELQNGKLRVEGVRSSIADFDLSADFEVAPGERAALIGPSGSGKTTLLRILAGLERLEPGKGRIFLGEAEITALPPRSRQIGLVFQDNALFPSLSVLENAIFGLRVRGVARSEAEPIGMSWLEKVGLAPLAKAPVHRLSGGEASRVAYVRALIWKPRLLLLDEPFASLDPELRVTVRSELIRLHELWPVPLVLVSHDPEDLRAVATVRLEILKPEASRLRTVVRVPLDEIARDS